MITREIRDSLNKMELGELRRLIDCCLNKEATVSGKSLSFVTQDIDKISQYIDVLESKKKPIYSPLNFLSSPLIIPMSVSDLKKENEKMIATKEQIIIDCKQMILNLKKALIIVENTKKHIFFNKKSKKKSTQLKRFIKEEEERYNKLNRLFNEEKRRGFEKEIRKQAEIQQKQIEEEFNKKLNQYKSSYEAELEIYENSISARIIKRLRSEVKSFSSYKLSTQKLNWKLLPTGEIPFHYLRNYLQEVSKFSKEEFDFEKIEKITTLNADKIHCGIDDFNGYLVFLFEEVGMAVLDCPKKGNAIYIFGEDWKTLSRLTKFDLLNYHSDKTKRIIHRGGWFERLKLILQTHRKNS